MPRRKGPRMKRVIVDHDGRAVTMHHPIHSSIESRMPYGIRTSASWGLCWCCHRRLFDHPSLCHCGQPHYCEGRPPNWGQNR